MPAKVALLRGFGFGEGGEQFVWIARAELFQVGRFKTIPSPLPSPRSCVAGGGDSLLVELAAIHRGERVF